MANSSGNTGAEVVDVRRFFVSFAQRRSVRLCEEETNHHLFGMPFAFCKRSLPVHTFIAAENLGAFEIRSFLAIRKARKNDEEREERNYLDDELRD